MCEKEFIKCVVNNRNSDVYIWYMVSTWACEVTNPHTKEASSVLLCMRIPVTS